MDALRPSDTIIPLRTDDLTRSWLWRDLVDFVQMHIGWCIGTPDLANLFGLLRVVQDSKQCTFHSLVSGNVTISVSGWIVDKEWEKVLLIRRRKLDGWFQPGGHADGGFNLLLEAMRVCREETGLTSIRTVAPYIFDVDILDIYHYDVCFLLQADKDEPFRVAGHEIPDIRWIPFSEFRKSPELSTPRMSRMIQKCFVLPPILKDFVL